MVHIPGWCSRRTPLYSSPTIREGGSDLPKLYLRRCASMFPYLEVLDCPYKLRMLENIVPCPEGRLPLL